MESELKKLIADLIGKATDMDLLDLIYKILLESMPEIIG